MTNIYLSADHPLFTECGAPIRSQLEEGSPEYNVIAERNALDMILYNYITLLYSEQKVVIDAYASMQGQNFQH